MVKNICIKPAVNEIPNAKRLTAVAAQALAQGRTSITVAHRLSTVQHCDLIVVLQDGRVVEQGSHSAMLSHRGMYASMWQVCHALASPCLAICCSESKRDGTPVWAMQALVLQ